VHLRQTLRRLLEKLTGKGSAERAAKRRRLELEQLEDRALLSGGMAVWTDQGPNPISGLSGALPTNTGTPVDNSAVGAVQSVVVAHVPVSAQNPGGCIVYAGTANGGVWRADNFTDSMVQLALSDNNLSIIGPRSMVDASSGGFGGVITPAGVQAGSPHWRPLTDQQQSLSVSSMALDPLDPSGQTLWVGTGSLSSTFPRSVPPGPRPGSIGLLLTTDGGLTWVNRGQQQFGGVPVLHVTTSVIPGGSSPVETLVVANENGVWYSQDGGRSFLTNPVLPGNAQDLLRDPNSPGVVYAAVTGASQGVFRSTDGGRDWQPVAAAQPVGTNARDLKLALFKNVGPNGQPISPTFHMMHADGSSEDVPVGPTLVYVATAGTIAGGDNGLSGLFWIDPAASGPAWRPINADSADLPRKGAAIPTFGFAVDPTDPTMAWVSGDGGWVWRADARTWTSWNSGGPGDTVLPSFPPNTPGNGTYADSRSLTFLDGQTLLETDDGGIYGLNHPQDPLDRLNPGRWVSLNNTMEDTEFVSVAYDTTTGLISGGAQDTGTPAQVPAVDANGNPTGVWGWALLPGGVNDGGETAVDDNGIHYYFNDYQFLRDGTPVPLAGLSTADQQALQAAQGQDGWFRFALGSGNRVLLGSGVLAGLYESLDQGNHVTNITPGGLNGAITALAYGRDNPNAIYVGTSTGQLFLRTAGNGAPAFLASYPGAGAQVDAIAVDRSDWRKAVVLGDDGRLFYTSDGGQSWHNIRGDDNGTGMATILQREKTIELAAVGPDEVVLAGGTGTGGNAGVARTIIAGGVIGTSGLNVNATWTPFGTGLPHALVTDLHYIPPVTLANGSPGGDVLLAGTLGRGAWTVANASASLDTSSAGPTVTPPPPPTVPFPFPSPLAPPWEVIVFKLKKRNKWYLRVWNRDPAHPFLGRLLFVGLSKKQARSLGLPSPSTPAALFVPPGGVAQVALPFTPGGSLRGIAL
jgi:hypothetical protein